MTTLTQVERSGPVTERDSAAAGDSIAVAAWTLVSRITGVVKIAAIGAVLGPTFFGNAYQFTNSLPNLIYYGLLAGSLFSSLLVPALVGHIDAGDRAASERVAGGFLGMTLLALVAAVPLAVVFGPTVLSLAASGPGSSASAQEQVGRWLILMFVPQLFLYGIVGAATAAMNAHRRFALAAAAPALENLGTIVVLAACAIVFGTGTQVDAVPNGELVLLGSGNDGRRSAARGRAVVGGQACRHPTRPAGRLARRRGSGGGAARVAVHGPSRARCAAGDDPAGTRQPGGRRRGGLSDRAQLLLPRRRARCDAGRVVAASPPLAYACRRRHHRVS